MNLEGAERVVDTARKRMLAEIDPRAETAADAITRAKRVALQRRRIRVPLAKHRRDGR
jgi:hypothetical protein